MDVSRERRVDALQGRDDLRVRRGCFVRVGDLEEDVMRKKMVEVADRLVGLAESKTAQARCTPPPPGGVEVDVAKLRFQLEAAVLREVGATIRSVLEAPNELEEMSLESEVLLELGFLRGETVLAASLFGEGLFFELDRHPSGAEDLVLRIRPGGG